MAGSVDYNAPSCHRCETMWLEASYLEELEQPSTKIVFLSDCKSVLENLQSPAKDHSTAELQAALSRLATRHTISLQWIPSHCQIEGNEKADRLSKGRSCRNNLSPTLYPEAKGLIKNSFRQSWKKKHNILSEDTSLQGLDRWQQTIAFRLRTGHCQLLLHMYHLLLSHTHV